MGLRQETMYEKKDDIALDEWFVPIEKQHGEAEAVVRPSLSYWQEAWRNLWKNKLAMGAFFS